MPEMRKKRSAITTVLTCLLVAANLVVTNLILNPESTGRLDLTEDSRFVLSKGTQGILDRLEDSVTITCYFSSNLPQRYDHVGRSLLEKLQEYETASEGRVVYKFVDPETDEAVRQECEDLGVTPANIEEFESVSKPRSVTCYMGMVCRYADRKNILNFFSELRGSLDNRAAMAGDLEFNITSQIQKVANERRTIGLLAKIHEVPTNPRNPQSPKQKTQGLNNLTRWLERAYDVLPLDPESLNGGQPIPAEVDTLICFRPEDMNELALFTIDQFIVHGAPVLFCVDSGTANMAPQQKQTTMGNMKVQDFDLPTYAGVVINHGMDEFFHHLGVLVKPDFVEDPSCLKIGYYKDKELKQHPLTRQVYAQGIPGQDDYLPWIVVPARDESGAVIDDEQVNAEHAIVAGIKDVVLTWAAPLSLVPESLDRHEATATVLLRSGPKSWSRPVLGGTFSPMPGDRTEAEEKAPASLFVSVNGRFRSYFKGEETPEIVENPEKRIRGVKLDESLIKGRIDIAAEETSLMVLGDADFISDQTLGAIAQIDFQKARNRDLAMNKPRAALSMISNAVHVLTYATEGLDLIQIKAKAARSRAIIQMEKDDPRIAGVYTLQFGWIPAMILGFGLLRFLMRAASTR